MLIQWILVRPQVIIFSITAPLVQLLKNVLSFKASNYDLGVDNLKIKGMKLFSFIDAVCSVSTTHIIHFF